MFVKFGNYTHPENEAIPVSFTKRVSFNNRGGRDIVTFSVTVRGVLIPASATQTSITTSIDEIEDAYASGDKDWGFYEDDGAGGIAALTTVRLTNATSIGGVRVMSISFPEGDGAEYATGRTFEIVLEADYHVTVGLLSFTETTSITGTGGPKKVWRHCINSPPVEQQVYPATSVKGTQRGEEVRSDTWGEPPGRLFGGEHGDRRGVSKTISDDRGRKIYRTTWNYNFENNSLRLVAPHIV